jgi:hypothetical protein
MPQALQPQLAHQFAGIIWRMEIDAQGNFLALEIRNEQDKQVSFAAINLNTATVTLQNYVLEERWMAGLEGVYKGVLLLHYYQSAGSPSHKGIIAVNANTSQQIWADYNLAFHHFSENGPVVYDARLQPRALQLLDISSGKIIRLYQPDTDLPIDSQVVAPDMVPGNGDLPEPAVGNIVHQLLYKDYIIVSLHTQTDSGGLEQKLFVIANGHTLYTDLLNTGIQKLQPEAFVLHNNQLIYLKDRLQLKIINL